jgi:hypothetical protein
VRCAARQILSQRQLADLLDIPLNTFRMWDSGLRRPPAQVVTRTRETLAAQARRHELLPLARLAQELGVHIRTLQAAARTGRLKTQFNARSVIRSPDAFRLAGRGRAVRRPALALLRWTGEMPGSLPTVPDDYDKRLRDVRRRRCLTQGALAQRIGAAGKAVVYQAFAIETGMRGRFVWRPRYVR